MKVAIVGAGFAGVAATYVLARAGYDVTLFDEKGIGKGASGAATGLLHPYPGRFPTRKEEAFLKALELVQMTHAIRSKGIVRLSYGSAQRRHFQKCANRYEDVEEVEGGILLKEGVTIDATSYLQGLVEASGSTFRQEKVFDPPFERIVYANGAEVPVEVELVKGQALVLRWPQGLPPLPYSIIGKKMVAMEGDCCAVGATFEKSFKSEKPDLERATEELMPFAVQLIPELALAEVVGVRSGLRAYLPGKGPGQVIQLDEKRYAIAGLGSKGLLTHALLAEKLLELWGG